MGDICGTLARELTQERGGIDAPQYDPLTARQLVAFGGHLSGAADAA
jgi:hypothetical protein